MFLNENSLYIITSCFVLFKFISKFYILECICFSLLIFLFYIISKQTFDVKYKYWKNPGLACGILLYPLMYAAELIRNYNNFNRYYFFMTTILTISKCCRIIISKSNDDLKKNGIIIITFILVLKFILKGTSYYYN